MGVRGLTTYVTKYAKPVRFELKDCQIVIDGKAFIQYIFRVNNLDIRYGGQSNRLFHYMLEFMSTLKTYNVQVIVICDGQFDPKLKGPTKIKRMNQHIKALADNEASLQFSFESYFSSMLFEICKKFNFKFVRDKNEADRSIALIANHFIAPVLSEDSDFFIFNLLSGYISLNSLKRESTTGLYVGNIIRPEDVAKIMLINVSDLPVMAALIGNDIVDYWPYNNEFEPFRRKYPQGHHILKLGRFIQSCTNHDDAIEKYTSYVKGKASSELRSLAKFVYKGYTLTEVIDGKTPQSIITKLLSWINNSDEMSKYFDYNSPKEQKKFQRFLLYKGISSAHTLMSTKLGILYLTFPVQDLSKASVHNLTIPLRKEIYKLLNIPENSKSSVNEFDRIEKDYTHKNIIDVETLDDSERLCIKSHPLCYLLKILNMFDLPKGKIDVIEDSKLNLDWTFIICVLNYIIKNSPEKFPPKMLKIFLLSLVENIYLVNDGSHFKNTSLPQTVSNLPSNNINLLHFVGYYSSVISFLETLNYLLNVPIPPFPQKFYYDGIILMKNYSKLYSANDSEILSAVSKMGPIEHQFNELYSLCFNA